MQQKRFPEAIAAFEQAKSISPSSYTADFGLAQVYIAQGDYDRAISTLLSLPKADQSTPIAHFQLSLAYAGRGDKEKALLELQKAIDVRLPRFCRHQVQLASLIRLRSDLALSKAADSGKPTPLIEAPLRL